MPAYKIRRDELHDQLAVIERQREQVVSITPNHEDPDCFDVVTRDADDKIETRGDAA